MKQLIKKIIPTKFWVLARKHKILSEHYKTSKVCKALIKRLESGDIQCYQTFPKKQLVNTLIIWQYWAQGYDNVPELIRICLDSVERYKGNYTIIRLTDNNLKEYIDIPDQIYRKRDKFGIAFFSDLLRCALLTTYGGVWLDATILLTGPLTEKLSNGFFMYQRDDAELDKSYWENSYAYYWGWDKNFKVRMLSSIVYASNNCVLITDITNMMYTYWMEEDVKLSYFFMQILFNEYVSRYPARNCLIKSDCIPHYLMQILTDNFSYLSFHEVINLTNIHKLTYKMPDSCVDQLKDMLNLH